MGTTNRHHRRHWVAALLTGAVLATSLAAMPATAKASTPTTSATGPTGMSPGRASVRLVAAQPATAPFVWVRPGMKGSRVLTVQRALKRRGYRVIANGKFGPMTRAAVRKFQRNEGLRVTGHVGPQTWKALGLNNPPTTTTSTTTVATTVAPGSYRHPRASVERWRDLAIEVGWDAAQWKRLSCIINRESGGYPNAHNPSGARGLLQILYSAHRGRVGPDPTVLFDARTNLTIGLAIFRASGWRPWGSGTCAG